MAISALLADPNKLMYLAVVFWIFVAVVVWAALWYAKSRNREKQKTIRLAIEKGVDLNPALIESLDKDRPAKPEDYYIGGFICTAAGIGLIPLGYFLKQIAVEAFYPLVGAGILVILVGLSMLLVAQLIRRRNNRRENGYGVM
jgi:hypothetical protein